VFDDHQDRQQHRHHPVTNNAVVSVTKSVSAASVGRIGPYTYTLTYTNTATAPPPRSP